MGETPTERARRSLEVRRKEFRKRHPKVTNKDVDDLERQAEEKRKEEQQIAKKIEKLKEETKVIVAMIVRTCRNAADDEDKDADKYEYWTRDHNYKDMPTVVKLFSELSREETEHASRLRRLADELERKVGKGYIEELYKEFPYR